MSNHPNRSGNSASKNPSPLEIKQKRECFGLTPESAAKLIHCSGAMWLQWESGDRRMHPAFWELFLIKS